jgi:hypothetical protein
MVIGSWFVTSMECKYEQDISTKRTWNALLIRSCNETYVHFSSCVEDNLAAAHARRQRVQ